MTETINLLIGVLGLCLVLSGFLLENLLKVHKSRTLMNLLTMSGSLLLIYYAFTLNSIIFIILNSVWVVFAIYFLVKRK